MLGSLTSLLDSAQGSVTNAGGSISDLIDLGFGSLSEMLVSEA